MLPASNSLRIWTGTPTAVWIDKSPTFSTLKNLFNACLPPVELVPDCMRFREPLSLSTFKKFDAMEVNAASEVDNPETSILTVA